MCKKLMQIVRYWNSCSRWMRLQACSDPKSVNEQKWKIRLGGTWEKGARLHAENVNPPTRLQCSSCCILLFAFSSFLLFFDLYIFAFFWLVLFFVLLLFFPFSCFDFMEVGPRWWASMIINGPLLLFYFLIDSFFFSNF